MNCLASQHAVAGTAPSWHRRIASAGLALAGCGISLYLALFQYGVIEHVWEPLFGQGTVRVLESDILAPVSRAVGFPLHDAALGGAAYLVEAILAVAGGRARDMAHPGWLVAYAVVVACMAMTSLALILIQGCVVHAWCTLCLASASASLAIAALSWDDLAAAVRWVMRRGRHPHSMAGPLRPLTK